MGAPEPALSLSKGLDSETWDQTFRADWHLGPPSSRRIRSCREGGKACPLPGQLPDSWFLLPGPCPLPLSALASPPTSGPHPLRPPQEHPPTAPPAPPPTAPAPGCPDGNPHSAVVHLHCPRASPSQSPPPAPEANLRLRCPRPKPSAHQSQYRPPASPQPT